MKTFRSDISNINFRFLKVSKTMTFNIEFKLKPC